MKEQLKDALDILYGSAQYPVCAADRSLQIVWQSGAEAERLTEQLRTVLSEPLREGAVQSTLLTDGDAAFRCEIEPLSGADVPLFLLRFLPAARSSTLNRTESVLLLREQNALLHSAGTAILYAADRLNRTPDADGLPAELSEREPFLSIQDSCYALLRQSLCNQELLWYESASAPFGVIELTRPLRRFFGQTELLTERYLHAGVCDTESRLFAETDEKRLLFALSALLIGALRDIEGQNVLDLRAGRAEGNLRVELVLRHDPAYQKEPFPLSGRLSRSASTASADLLLDRFCEMFRARILRQAADGKIVCTLELPAAEMPGTVLRSPAVLPEESRFSLFHVMLSALIPAEVLWESNPALW